MFEQLARAEQRLLSGLSTVLVVAGVPIAPESLLALALEGGCGLASRCRVPSSYCSHRTWWAALSTVADETFLAGAVVVALAVDASGVAVTGTRPSTRPHRQSCRFLVASATHALSLLSESNALGVFTTTRVHTDTWGR